MTDTTPLSSTEIDAYLSALPHGMGGLNEKMGVTLTEISVERVVATMPVEGNTQPYGLLHGGASIALAETLGSVGSGLHAQTLGKLAVGVDINATHHRAATSGIVTGVATPAPRGRTTARLHGGASPAPRRRPTSAVRPRPTRSSSPTSAASGSAPRGSPAR